MKLRNKKTGEIKDLECITVFDRPDENDTGDAEDEFYTIAELNENWEDYTPAEPLIKDEKIRKAVRAWADANNITKVEYDKAGGTLVALHNPAKISFNGSLGVKADEWAILGIAELCGEEEE